MPSALTYPGVYIEEIPSGVRTITGVATSIAAFIGRAPRGPVNRAVTITSFADYERTFGGLSVDSTMSYAVRDFFLNGGTEAVIVRIYALPQGGTAKAILRFAPGFDLEAKYEGAWGAKLKGTIDVTDTSKELENALGPKLFNLTVEDTATGRKEAFFNLSLRDNARRIDRVLENESLQVRWTGAIPSDPTQIPTGTDFTTNLRPLATDLANAEAALAALPPNDSGIPAATAKVTAAKAKVDAENKKLSDALKALKDDLDLKEKALTDLGPETDQNKDAIAKAKSERDAAKALHDADQAKQGALAGNVADSAPLNKAAYFPANGQQEKKGLFALENADIFNLLCIPPDTRNGDTDIGTYQDALVYCTTRRAMLIVDSPSKWNTDAGSQTLISGPAAALESDVKLNGEAARNAAIYYPRVRQSDLLRDGQIDTFVPCGIMAGIMARTDVRRGVWKAPAGLDATLLGIQALAVKLTDLENGKLNPVGINCLRTFPGSGSVSWGARTLRGDDRLGDEYKYVPVRRLALFIEESLYRGTQWVVFEPNDEPLWAQIRLNLGAFMHNLFRQGAFQGKSPREAYFVKCDNQTTTQNDINLGIVNIVVGFAPLKPAEFVVIKIQQIAGKIET